MRYKTGVDKQQLTLLPVSLDEYVSEAHICRVIYAFTEQLKMGDLGYKHAECKSTGCRPYDPRMMLNLYIYGYLHRVRSSRRLRDEAVRNVEVMWLLDGLRPDDKTISNFRTDNKAALKQTFREFVQMCRTLGLYGGEVEATDSTKVRANNALKNNHNETTVKNALSKIDRKISDYLEALEQADNEEQEEKTPDAEAIREALEQLRRRKEKYEGLKAQVAEQGEVSTVDEEARMMRFGGDERHLSVGYNIQTIVDSKYHLIVDFEVTNCASDSGNLHRMSAKAKEALGVEHIINLADSGYYNSADIVACEEDGVTCLVAKGRPGGPQKAAGFTHECFVYNREEDVYTCPGGDRLEYKRNKKHVSGREYRVYANYEACGICPCKAECTKGKFREVQRLACQDTLDVVDERTRSNRELYRKRQEIAEHPFGTIKAVWGFKQFLCRGKAKVTAETALSYLAYNMRRVFNISQETKLKLAFG